MELEQILEPCQIHNAVVAVEQYRNKWLFEHLTRLQQTVMGKIQEGYTNADINREYGMHKDDIAGLRRIFDAGLKLEMDNE